MAGTADMPGYHLEVTESSSKETEQTRYFLDNLSDPKAALIVAVSGIAACFSGLWGAFLGDDLTQIVVNPVMQSLGNIAIFFQGSTFYLGRGTAPLSGTYYKPLTTTVYSVLYTFFGLSPDAFHITQVVLYVASAFLVYLVLKQWLKTIVALPLALLFVLHPLNAQVVFAIANMQDVLFFFFGMLAMWLLVHSDSNRALIPAAFCILLSLFSKETGLLFIPLTFGYLLLFDKRRLLPLAGLLVLPVAIYIVLRINAVGLASVAPQDGPIDQLGLGGRLLTAPSILLFYATQFVAPVNLALTYYWAYPTPTFGSFVLPLTADLAITALLVGVGMLIRTESRLFARMYCLFAGWLALGLLAHMQIVALDATASGSWFYFGMAGLVGMIGAAVCTFLPRLHPNSYTLSAIAVIVVLLALGSLTAARGLDFANAYTLSLHDASASTGDFVDQAILAQQLDNQGNLPAALEHARLAISIFPTGGGYEALGRTYYDMRDYQQSQEADFKALSFGDVSEWYYNLSLTMIFYGSPANNETFLRSALLKFPTDAGLWTDLAIIEYSNGDPTDAKSDIARAYSYSQVGATAQTYQIIMNNGQLNLNPGT